MPKRSRTPTLEIKSDNIDNIVFTCESKDYIIGNVDDRIRQILQTTNDVLEFEIINDTILKVENVRYSCLNVEFEVKKVV